MDAERPSIFVFSLEPWSDMWYSKHHYAAHLARTHTVHFVSLPDRWRWTDLFSIGVQVQHTAEGVRVVEYRNNLPLRFLGGWLANWMTRINARKLARLIPSGGTIFWCFHPTTLVAHLTNRKPEAKVIYHVVDPYLNLPNDTIFARSATLVVAINQWYLDHYGKLNPRCILVPHGVRKEDREPNAAAIEQYRSTWRRYMILATGLNRFVNYALLIDIAKRFAGDRLIIAGQMFPLEPREQALRDGLFALPNVSYIGVKHPDTLRDLIRGAALGLLTYEFEPTHSVPVSAGRTPLKVLTYLSQSCPVVSTNNSYVPVLDGKGYFKAEDEEHFMALVDDVLTGRRGVDHDAVNSYLDSVEYGQLIDRIFTALERSEKVHSVLAAHGEQADSPEGTKQIPADSPILIVSNEGWDGPRYSKHRYALALSAYRKVYFIDPPAQWKPVHFLRTAISSRSTAEGITVLSYNNAIPLFGGLLSSINDWIVSRRLRSFLRREGRSRPLFWTFDPRRLAAPSAFEPCASIYHCADDYGLRWRSERLLAQRCDHVFCIARDLMPRFDAMNRSVHYVPHGLSEADLAPSGPEAIPLPAAPGYGLYIGNINDRHDFALYEKLFQANTAVTWVFIGPVQVTDPIGAQIIKHAGHSNARFLPAVPYDQLRGLIAGAGFGFLYLKGNHPANRISSQKVVQFLAQGKPVFSSWLSEYAGRPDLVYMSDGHADALALFQDWKRDGDPPEYKAHRLDYAQHQRFQNLIAQLPFRL